MNKYIFKAGLYEPRRKVTVYAKDREQAVGKAKDELDRRAGEYAPVGWDLELVFMDKLK